MQPISKLLSLIGALCFVAAGISIGFTLAAPTATSAAPSLSIGTATPPPQPTDEPTVQPSPVPPTATGAPTSTPIASTSTPTDTPRPTRPPERKRPTPVVPTPTDPPTATPEQWTTEVEIIKQASTHSVVPGDTFVYSLVARNIGHRTAFDVVVSDDVPEQFEIVDLASTKGDIGVQGQTVTAYPRTLEAGESAAYRITVRVRANVTPSEIVNTGRISTTTVGDTPNNNTSTTTVVIRAQQQTVQTTHVPPQLPKTGGESVAILTVLATVSPLSWLGLFGGMLLMLGGVLSWGLRGWSRRPSARSGQSIQTQISAYRLPVTPIGPPRLGPALPPAQPAQPLPPLAPIDRDEALRDAKRDYPEN